MRNSLIILFIYILLIVSNLSSSQTLKDYDILVQYSSFFDVRGSLMFWTVISFCLLLFFLQKYVFPNILKVIYNREDEILENYRLSKENLIKTEKMKVDQQEILEKISLEMSHTIELAKKEASKIKEKYVQEALKDIESKKIQFEKEMQFKKESMIKDMNDKIIFLSLEISKELIQKNLDNKENMQLIKKLINCEK